MLSILARSHLVAAASLGLHFQKGECKPPSCVFRVEQPIVTEIAVPPQVCTEPTSSKVISSEENLYPRLCSPSGTSLIPHQPDWWDQVLQASGFLHPELLSLVCPPPHLVSILPSRGPSEMTNVSQPQLSLK